MSILYFIKRLYSREPDMHNKYPVLASASSLHDRGVFAEKDILQGEWIEISPLIPVPADQFTLLKGTSLHFYYFLTGNASTPAVIGLGMASLYNHGCPAAADYKIDLKKKVIRFRAVHNIRCGEEITINYNGSTTDETPVHFTEQV